MKFSLPTLTALLGLACAAPTAVNTTTTTPRNEPAPIEFHACKGFDLENNIYNIRAVSTDPQPIKRHADVHIFAHGQLRRTVDEGATVAIRISKGRRSHVLDYDFCKGVRSGCPVEAGEDVEWWTGQHIAGIVPAGDYKIEVKMRTNTGEMMSCVEAPVKIVS